MLAQWNDCTFNTPYKQQELGLQEKICKLCLHTQDLLSVGTTLSSDIWNLAFPPALNNCFQHLKQSG